MRRVRRGGRPVDLCGQRIEVGDLDAPSRDRPGPSAAHPSDPRRSRCTGASSSCSSPTSSASSAGRIFRFVADRVGGAILTTLAGLSLIGLCTALITTGVLAPESSASFPLFLGLMLAILFVTGVGNAATFRQYPLIFAGNPRQGPGVLGWTGAVAAYGPFFVSTLVGRSISATGSAAAFFVGAIAFYVIATAINWWYHTRRACEKPC